MGLLFDFKHPAQDRLDAGTYFSHDPKNECFDKERDFGKAHRVNYDPRWPNQNKTKYCYQMYLDFHRCTKKHGEGYDVCEYFKRHYENLCPIAWVSKWDEQREAGIFPGTI